MSIPIGTKFLTSKDAPKESGYVVKKVLPDKNYWCANIMHKSRGNNNAGTVFPKNVVEKMVNEPWQPAGFGKKKTGKKSVKEKSTKTKPKPKKSVKKASKPRNAKKN